MIRKLFLAIPLALFVACGSKDEPKTETPKQEDLSHLRIEKIEMFTNGQLLEDVKFEYDNQFRIQKATQTFEGNSSEAKTIDITYGKNTMTLVHKGRWGLTFFKESKIEVKLDEKQRVKEMTQNLSEQHQITKYVANAFQYDAKSRLLGYTLNQEVTLPNDPTYQYQSTTKIETAWEQDDLKNFEMGFVDHFNQPNACEFLSYTDKKNSVYPDVNILLQKLSFGTLLDSEFVLAKELGVQSTHYASKIKSEYLGSTYTFEYTFDAQGRPTTIVDKGSSNALTFKITYLK